MHENTNKTEVHLTRSLRSDLGLVAANSARLSVNLPTAETPLTRFRIRTALLVAAIIIGAYANLSPAQRSDLFQLLNYDNSSRVLNLPIQIQI